MPFYRIGEPGADFVAHINFGRKKGTPGSCVAPRHAGDNPKHGERCGRMAVALCDAPAGKDLAGKPLTCDAPICELDRTRGGENVDYCPRHKHLAPAELPL
jgi:hypothetical protein